MNKEQIGKIVVQLHSTPSSGTCKFVLILLSYVLVLVLICLTSLINNVTHFRHYHNNLYFFYPLVIFHPFVLHFFILRFFHVVAFSCFTIGCCTNFMSNYFLVTRFHIALFYAAIYSTSSLAYDVVT